MKTLALLILALNLAACAGTAASLPPVPTATPHTIPVPGGQRVTK